MIKLPLLDEEEGFVPNWVAWPSHACAHYSCGKLRHLTTIMVSGEEREVVRRWCELHAAILDAEALVQGGAVVLTLVTKE